MDWKKIYQERLVSAEEALSHVKSGDHVALGHALAEPTYLLEEMVRLKDNYKNVSFPDWFREKLHMRQKDWESTSEHALCFWEHPQEKR